MFNDYHNLRNYSLFHTSVSHSPYYKLYFLKERAFFSSGISRICDLCTMASSCYNGLFLQGPMVKYAVMCPVLLLMWQKLLFELGLQSLGVL